MIVRFSVPTAALIRAGLAMPVRLVAWLLYIGGVVLNAYARGFAMVADLIAGLD